MKTLTPALALLLLLPPARAAAPDAHCTPAPTQQLVQSFISADCASCWERPTGAGAARRSLRLDWIVPGTQGDEAPLAAAAVPEAMEHLKGPMGPGGVELRTQRVAPPPKGLTLKASSGLAWNGYIGLALDVARRGAAKLPAGAEGWVALVERVPAGTDGTPEARQLVRVVLGPLPLAFAAGQPALQHLRAVRLPANAQPERLAAVGWVQAQGRVLAAVQSLPSDCESP